MGTDLSSESKLKTILKTSQPVICLSYHSPITFTQQNGDATTSQISAIGKVNVTTGMGVFETFKYQTNSTTTLAAGGSRVSTTRTYVVPAIGPVKMTINQTASDALGAVSTSQFTLTASTTNIPF